MSQSKKKKIKKLRKSHVLPSIILFLASILISVFTLIFCTILFISYIANEEVINSAKEISRMSKIVSGLSSYEEQQTILENIKSYSDFSDSVCITDKDLNVLSAIGEITFDTNISGELFPASEHITLYNDLQNNSNFFIDVNTMVEILQNTFDFSPDMNKQEMMTEIIYTDHYWLSSPIADTDYLIMARFEFNLRRSGIMYLSTACIMLGILMLIPVLFQFINVIKNIFTHNKMRRLVYTDMVTGGKNRLYFEHYAGKALSSPFSSGRLLAVVDITLMKYRNFCAYHGVEEGENLLERMDRFLEANISRREFCAHTDKANFALLLRCDSREQCEDRLYGIMNALPKAIGHDNAVFHCGVFFAEPARSDSNLVLVKRKDTNISELYSYAGSARASIPDDNSNGVAIFDRALLEAQLWEHKVEEKMQQALENEEFVVYLQPKYNPVNDELAGAEALVRWINEEDGFISPGKFIPIFEKDGFIPKLDDYMISHVAKLQAEWMSEGRRLVPVSVNVSRAHFATPRLAEHICRLVDIYGVPHQFIEIELTESAFFDDKAVLLNTVNELKASGFKVSMDDFGAGYSSLNSLKDLPLDVLKLDADFFRGGEAERGEIVVSEAIQLAKKLDMKIVAEGVEKKDQVDFLASHGCDMIQGYYYAKPMPADEYKERMDKCELPVIGEPPQLMSE